MSTQRYPKLEALPDGELFKLEEKIRTAILGSDKESRRALNKFLDIVLRESRRRNIARANQSAGKR